MTDHPEIAAEVARREAQVLADDARIYDWMERGL